MRLLLRLLGLVLVLIVLLVGLAFALPDRVRVERTVTILRPPSQIYLVLTNMRRFNDWSPWYPRDREATYVYSGPDSGVGAKIVWKSERRDVGAGSQTLITAVPGQIASFELDFGMGSTSTSRFDLTPQNGETRVNWSLDMQLPLRLDESFGWGVAGRYFGVFMDRMVGPDLEAGLANLKLLTEQFPDVDIADVSPQLVDMPARRVVYVVVEAGADDAATLRRWNAAVAQLTRFAAQNGLAITGAPLGLTAAQDAAAGRFALALAAHYDVMPEDTAVRGRELPAARAAQLLVRGDIAERRRLGEKLHAWMIAKGLRGEDLVIEEYVEGDLLQGAARISIPLQATATGAR
jgi:effector-binding domain-containing protein